MKIAIVIDSSSGLTKEQANKRGWYFLPLNIDIDEKTYKDGIDLDNKNFFEIFKKNSKTSTSASSRGEIISLFDDITSKYDKVVVFPISYKLSSQYQNLDLIAREYKNIHIVKSKHLSFLTIVQLIKFEKAIGQNQSFDEELKKLSHWDESQKVLLIPEYNDALVAGGRLSPKAAALAKVLKVVPIIKFENGELLKEGKGISFQKTLTKLISSLSGKYSKDSKNYFPVILHAQNSNISFYEEHFLNEFGKKPLILSLPSVISVHTGLGAIAISLVKVDKDVIDQIVEHF
ncbi:conserved hypothetical protein [Mycoplasmopsis pulmonis]|uniref:DegV domain-containing protein MYPU_3590 n=1 Tax=Mycoplasmopsis pulmonis (strain UAB CTIP) TaxID=272635 RepID=Y359_MYCPU|nr:DegV family protein [Mycoplasmopsis pulmonis]Q98QK2.1 RecName: Full=DegV domain-containing protein MYPU_3590 [Mycoplasmopsis pulmonis UAB CTIP]MDZ7293316.1 DegV family protein [Mycoplasmopsis pulmonis]CAC13532.1 conserved hypothetical protein [Mycoplasmopsis pulmonis]